MSINNRTAFIISVLTLCASFSYAANAAGSEISIVSAMSVLLPKNAGSYELFDGKKDVRLSQGIWISRKYSDVSFFDGKDARALFWGFEAGYERIIAPGFSAGLSAGYNSGDTEIGGHAGAKISNEFYSVGLYGVKEWQNGTFARVFAKNFFTASGYKESGLRYSLDRSVSAFSGELGAGIDFKAFIFEPGFSLSYYGAPAKKTGNADFGSLSLLDAKISLLMLFSDIGKNFKLSPYIGAAFGYSLFGQSDLYYNGRSFISDISGSLVEAVLGARAVFSDSLSAQAGFNCENAQYGSSYGIALSVKYAFGQDKRTSSDTDESSLQKKDLPRKDKTYVAFKPIVGKDNPKTEDFYEDEVAELTAIEEYLPVGSSMESFEKAEDFDVENLNALASFEENKKRVSSASKEPLPEISYAGQASSGAIEEPEPEFSKREDLEPLSDELSAALNDEENYKEGSGKKITLGSLFFNPGQNEIDHRGKTYLNQVAKMLKDVNIKRVIITGHTDASGDGQDFMNEAISESRAASAAQTLIANGIPESKIRFKGEGSSKPLKKKKKKGQKSQPDKPSRRVEIEIFE
jgi:outer membrane protein OmpA-like peptidoglycan-associated protein